METLGFDVNDERVFEDFVPQGTYNGEIQSAKVGFRKQDDPEKGKAFLLQVVLFDVSDGAGGVYNHTVFPRFNIPNDADNKRARSFFGRRLQKLLKSAGIEATADTPLEQIADALVGCTIQWTAKAPRETDFGTFQDINPL